MSGRTVAIRYAKALYDISLKKDIVDIVTQDLSKMDQIIAESDQIRGYCLRRHSNSIIEMSFIDTAFIPYVNAIIGNTLRIAVRNGRLAMIPYLFPAFKKIIESESGILEVVIESGHELGVNHQNTISKRMKERLKKDIKLNNVIVPELLGGIRILWDNKMIDLSASGRLKKMRAFIKSI